jgi:hypothetical protein
MTPQEEIFARQIETVQHSLRALLQRASGSSDPQAVVAEAMQIISSSLEKLSTVAENLRRARDGLELRVQERTAELSKANEALRYQAHPNLVDRAAAITALPSAYDYVVMSHAEAPPFGRAHAEARHSRRARLSRHLESLFCCKRFVLASHLRDGWPGLGQPPW